MNSDIQQTLFKDFGKQFASKAEVQNNKRSRSAILRIARRTTLDATPC
jgi:16S rRNA C1402 N4-methylase RsmH